MEKRFNIYNAIRKFNTIDKKEINAVSKVLKSGVLSAFMLRKKGLWRKKVQQFENALKSFTKLWMPLQLIHGLPD